MKPTTLNPRGPVLASVNKAADYLMEVRGLELPEVILGAEEWCRAARIAAGMPPLGETKGPMQ
jgi:hypothetical protein